MASTRRRRRGTPPDDVAGDSRLRVALRSLRRLGAVASIAALSLICGCGGPAPARRSVVRMRCTLDFDAAQRQGRVRADALPRQVTETAVLVARERLAGLGATATTATVQGDQTFDLRCVLPASVGEPTLRRVLEAWGDLAFRIEVLPSYPDPAGHPGVGRRTRDTVWAGAESAPSVGGPAESFDATSEGFTRYKEREVERWRDARSRNRPYEPMDPRWRVVPKADSSGTSSEDFAVLEEPLGRKWAFDATAVDHATLPDVVGRPGRWVFLEIRPAYREPFREWTTQNVGLPMAVVYDGLYRGAAVLNAPLQVGAFVRLGGSSSGQDDRRSAKNRRPDWLVETAAVLRGGRMPAPLKLEFLHEGS